jgi:hypothetical protein
MLHKLAQGEEPAPAFHASRPRVKSPRLLQPTLPSPRYVERAFSPCAHVLCRFHHLSLTDYACFVLSGPMELSSFHAHEAGFISPSRYQVGFYGPLESSAG